jgi:hypothetical protein
LSRSEPGAKRMRTAQTLQQQGRQFIKCAAVIAVSFLVATGCAAQATPAGPPPGAPWMGDLRKNPELMAEFGRLAERLRQELRFPPARGESKLLPLLPEATVLYAAFPNYGDVAHQTLSIFREELQKSAALREWWQHGEVGMAGPKVEEALEKVYELFQYLGGEIVVSGGMQGREPKLLIVAETRKPGLKTFLQQMNELAGKSKQGVRVFEPRELAAAEERRPGDLVVLVRPDFVVGALDLATLRSFNARLDQGGRDFASSPFGRRVAQAYEGGVTVLGGADLHKILSQVPTGTKQNELTFERTGFADAKYLVWEHTNAAGQAVSQTELSFMGPRHGAASWLAAPGPMGSLDFVSPKAMLVSTVLLKGPAQIFDEVKEIASPSNPNAFAGLAAMEQALGITLKEGLLSHLGGEITVEVDDVDAPLSAWRAILRVNDPDRLQQTLSTLLAATNTKAEQVEEGGITYYTARVPSGKTTMEIGYAFVDGYLVIASSHEAAGEAVRLHQSGESLGRSSKFLALLPPGHPAGASAMFYVDPVLVTALRQRLAPSEAMGSLARLPREIAPTVSCAYGEETAIRGASTSATMDAAVVLVVAAVAIPNLLRSKVAANEASAVGTIRTVNVAQITYDATYPERGYAPDLATLGPEPGGASAGTADAGSADHAGLLDATLGNPNCTVGSWCEKSGYRFSLTAVCYKQVCKKFAVVAMPVSSETGTRSFCSASDGVIRFKIGPPLTLPVTASQCQAWAPLQ